MLVVIITTKNQKSSPSPVPNPKSKVTISSRCVSCSGRKHKLPGEPVIEIFAVIPSSVEIALDLESSDLDWGTSKWACVV